MTRRRALLRRTGCAVAVCLALASCSTEASPPDPDPSGSPSESASPDPQPPEQRATLTYGVFGSAAEVAASQEVVDAYNAQATTVEVELLSWPTSRAMVRDLDEGAKAPDIYQVSRDELAGVVDAERNVPLFGLLEDRDVSYGDNYPLDTIEAFSRDTDLQCMPYGISPMVLYLNTDLVDFDRMALRELPVPEDPLRGMDIEQFTAAINFATRPRLRAKGFSIDPSLGALAPYLLSGGGSLFDDNDEPTSLDLSSDDNRETLATLLELARNPRTTLTDAQLSQATPLEWFERGRLGMFAGDRSITPALREVPDLSFDVMMMPRVGRTVTTGSVTGVCISAGGQVQRAADFLVHLISADGFAPVAQAGYLVPANTSVARSDVFLQPGQQPENAGAFNASIDALELQNVVADDRSLRAGVGPLVAALFTSATPVGEAEIELATAEIDEISRPILDPTYVSPTESPEASPSASPSASASPSESVSPSP